MDEKTPERTLKELADELFQLRSTTWNGLRVKEEELTLTLNAIGISGLTKLFDALEAGEPIHEGIIHELKAGVEFGLEKEVGGS